MSTTHVKVPVTFRGAHGKGAEKGSEQRSSCVIGRGCILYRLALAV